MRLGFFLDYPLGDVIGFYQNGGQNYNVLVAGKYIVMNVTFKMFQKYHKCQEVYLNLWAKGREFCS